MSELSATELSSFLSSDARVDVKYTALEYTLGLTGSEEGREWIQSQNCIVEKLLELLSDKNNAISKNAHLALVNLSSDHGMLESLKGSVSRMLTWLCDPQWTHADKLCTILSNLSRTVKGAEVLFEALTQSENEAADAVTLYQLVDIFDRWKTHNKNANFHYLASVFLNLSQVAGARQLFLDHSKCVLPRLLPYTHFAESLIRRGSIAGLLKNLCFEVGHHKWLLSEEVDLLPSLLFPLAGPEQFKEEEMEKLPEDLQYLPDDKTREPDADIRKMLLDALTKLCCTKHGRDFLREKQTYVILRELHKWEEDAEAKQTCENLVHILILDEPDSGPENWDEIELKEAQT